MTCSSFSVVDSFTLKPLIEEELWWQAFTICIPTDTCANRSAQDRVSITSSQTAHVDSDMSQKLDIEIKSNSSIDASLYEYDWAIADVPV